jgi:ATP-binding cassette subfamily C (CFTR/MRP) protein 1
MLDTSQRPSYLLAMVQQWLLLVMNMITAVLAVVLVSLAIKLPGVDSGSVGAGLVMLITFGGALSNVVNSYTGLEISLGAIARLKAFSETTEREDKDGEDGVLGEEWPLRGHVVISGVSASYSGDPEALVLSDLSLIIQPREKMAVCGRTGRYVCFPLCFTYP